MLDSDLAPSKFGTLDELEMKLQSQSRHIRTHREGVGVDHLTLHIEVPKTIGNDNSNPPLQIVCKLSSNSHDASNT